MESKLNHQLKTGKYEIRINDKLHSLKDLPAVIFANGDKEWYENNVLSRLSKNGPAVLRSDGSFEYFKNGVYHRHEKEGPAIEIPNEIRFWYEKGDLHRSNDLPAIEIWNGEKWIGVGLYYNGRCYWGHYKSLCLIRDYSSWRNLTNKPHSFFASIERKDELIKSSL